MGSAVDGKHGALAQMPFFTITWFGTVDQVAAIVAAAVLGVGYGLLLVLWTRRILDRVVPPEIRDQVLKERRREARRGQLGGGPPGPPLPPDPPSRPPPPGPP